MFQRKNNFEEIYSYNTNLGNFDVQDYQNKLRDIWSDNNSSNSKGTHSSSNRFY